MKRILLSLFIVLTTLASQAQLPSGVLAPNFTTTDLDGNTYELYDLLSQGYTVVMDISATWCGPCWSYHTGQYNGSNGEGALHALHNEHGIDAGGNVFVIYIEGDAQTTLADLNGTGAATQGDWVAGTPYPIADDAAVADLYEIGYFPTIYTICPNGIVYETGQLTVEDHWAFIEDLDCQTVSSNDAIIIDYVGVDFTCDIVDVEVEFANIGLEDITALSFTVTGVNPELSYDWSGVLSTFESTTINLGTTSVVSGQEVVISIVTLDDNASNNMTSVALSATESTTHIHFSMLTDEYPGDYRITIFDDNNNAVASGGPWADFDVQLDPMQIDEDYYLPATGCYSVVIYDDFGDGLYSGYASAYGVEANGVSMANIVNVALGVPFETFSGATSVSEVVSVAETNFVSDFVAYPNPTDNMLNVRFTSLNGGKYAVVVMNTMGQRVAEYALGTLSTGVQQTSLDLSNLSSGVYMLRLSSEQGETTMPVIVR
ncbi:MAG: T9SS type A sorting domain-containing protein [Flavobacteriales bacterium]|nr:T9SS type A sorting domain-containing protein [Flavobacteriales bacterium]